MLIIIVHIINKGHFEVVYIIPTTSKKSGGDAGCGADASFSVFFTCHFAALDHNYDPNHINFNQYHSHSV